MATATCLQKKLCKKDAEDNSNLSLPEQLEEACWNGLLDEYLPGIVKKPVSGKKLFLWQIRQCEAFIEIELSDSLPLISENEFSIDPYLFFDTMSFN
jgi:hypothetical protein